MIDSELLGILICPVTGGRLEYDETEQVLISNDARLKYPVVDGIPVMLPERATKF